MNACVRATSSEKIVSATDIMQAFRGFLDTSPAMERIGEVLATLKARGMTILLVEQNFRFASRVADRFYLMEHGQITADFPASELEQRMEELHEVIGV